MKTCRILVNTPSSHGGIGDLYNFKLAPSLTLGCGSWGGNSVSENVGVKHLLNIKTVAERRENMLWFRAPEKVYLKKGCLPVALDELKHVMGKKKAFIVTDSFLYHNGYTKPITDKLDELGIAHTTFFDVAPDPDAGLREGGREGRWRSFRAGRDHRAGRRLRHGRGQDHVGDVRASGSGLHGYGHAVHGYPQARVHLPEDGRKGLLHRDSDLGGHRLRGDALRGHHG